MHASAYLGVTVTRTQTYGNSIPTGHVPRADGPYLAVALRDVDVCRIVDDEQFVAHAREDVREWLVRRQAEIIRPAFRRLD